MLNFLDLSRNQFSGKVPHGLQNLKLNQFHLSYNRLNGELPPQFAKELYQFSFLGNSSLCGYLCRLTAVDKSKWILILFDTLGFGEDEILNCFDEII